VRAYGGRGVSWVGEQRGRGYLYAAGAGVGESETPQEPRWLDEATRWWSRRGWFFSGMAAAPLWSRARRKV